jgi:Na+/H+-translocating membrane pyrophosphatase
MPSQGLMMLHVLFGVLGILFAVALFVDVLNAHEGNYRRIKKLSSAVAILIVLAFLIGGYWYVVYYGADREIIKAGKWPWAHNYFMEVKEHIFFSLLLLSIYLPIAVRGVMPLNSTKKKNLILGICALIILLGLFMEGAGGIISKGVTMGLGR